MLRSLAERLCVQMANAGRTFAPGQRQPYGSLETLAAEKGDSLIERVLSVMAILRQLTCKTHAAGP
jgi:hypothetical protein